MKFHISQETRRGARHSNQDRVGYMYTKDTILMVVCDGMGGHEKGELAAHFVVDYFAKSFKQNAIPKLKDPSQFLRKTILMAHSALLSHAENEKMNEVPRTTCVAVVIQGPKMAWAHVGDSRIYHLRDDEVVKRTIDHSQVQLMIDRKEITEEEAQVHKDRNKIFNCIGQPNQPRVDVEEDLDLVPGDCVILATDGLWGPVPANLMARVLNRMKSDVGLTWLMNLSEIYSGRECDNLSAVLLKWVGESGIDVEEEKQEDPMILDDEMVRITIESIRTSCEKKSNR